MPLYLLLVHCPYSSKNVCILFIIYIYHIYNRILFTAPWNDANLVNSSYAIPYVAWCYCIPWPAFFPGEHIQDRYGNVESSVNTGGWEKFKATHFFGVWKGGCCPIGGCGCWQQQKTTSWNSPWNTHLKFNSSPLKIRPKPPKGKG